MLDIHYLYIISEGEQQAKLFHYYKVTEGIVDTACMLIKNPILWSLIFFPIISVLVSREHVIL